MLNRRSLILYWLPVLAWMVLIFVASTDLMSSQHTSRFIGPLLRWFKPDIADATIWQVQVVVRKCGHLSEYAVLAVLFWRARRQPAANDSRAWSWREARFALLFAALYAATDEFHQSFVASRYASGWDVLIDSIGAAIGLLLWWCLGHLQKKW